VEDENLQAPFHNNAPLPVLWHKPSGSESTSTTELQNGTSLSILAANEGKSEQADEEDGDVLNYLFSRHSNIVGASSDLLGRSREVESVQQLNVAESRFNIDTRNQLANCFDSLATCTARCRHECDVCHCMFNSNDLLLRHKAIHTSVKAYECEICSKAFDSKYHLRRHQLIHTGEKPFACIKCGKAFNQMCTLVAHRRTHSDEKLFECSVCHEAFRQQQTLDRHQRMHSSLNMFKCEICSKRFTQSGHLKRHKVIHTGETPYSCNIDTHDQLTNTSDGLETCTARSIHECDVCHCTFSSNDLLLKHKAIHTGLKAYACETCSKAFPSKYHLRRHKVIHTGETPYSCDVCHKAFNHPGNLQRHKLLHSR